MTRLLLAVVVAFIASDVASAQRQPGGNRPGGMQGGSIAPQVVTNKDLQSDLKVTDAQKEKFKDVATKQADMRKKQQELFTGGERPDRAKMQEVMAEMTKVNEEVTKVVTENLTAEQKKRLKQIETQRMGLRAFSNADVVKELALTDEQKAKVKTIGDELAKELGTGGRPMGRPMPGTQPDPEAAKKRAEANAKALEKAVDVLDGTQKTKWKELIGEKFDLTKLNTLGRAPMRDM